MRARVSTVVTDEPVTCRFVMVTMMVSERTCRITALLLISAAADVEATSDSSERACGDVASIAAHLASMHA